MIAADRMASVDKLTKLAQDGLSGADWYGKALTNCKRDAAKLGVSVRRYVEVLAITSPRVSVSKNRKLAIQYLSSGSTAGMLPSVVRSLEVYEESGVIHGKKTGAFAEAIITGGISSALVLDVWMARALGVEQQRLFNKANHGKAISRCGEVAERLGLTVAQAQACIWSGTVLRYGGTLEVRDL